MEEEMGVVGSGCLDLRLKFNLSLSFFTLLYRSVLCALYTLLSALLYSHKTHTQTFEII